MYNNFPIDEIYKKIGANNHDLEEIKLISYIKGYNNAQNEEEKKKVIHSYYFEYDKKYREQCKQVKYESCLYCDSNFNIDIGCYCDCGSNEPHRWAEQYDYSNYRNKFHYNEYGINQLTSQKINNIFLINDVNLSFDETLQYKKMFCQVYLYFKSKQRKNMKSDYVLKKIFILMGRRDISDLFKLNHKLSYKTFLYYEKVIQHVFKDYII